MLRGLMPPLPVCCCTGALRRGADAWRHGCGGAVRSTCSTCAFAYVPHVAARRQTLGRSRAVGLNGDARQKRIMLRVDAPLVLLLPAGLAAGATQRRGCRTRMNISAPGYADHCIPHRCLLVPCARIGTVLATSNSIAPLPYVASVCRESAGLRSIALVRVARQLWWFSRPLPPCISCSCSTPRTSRLGDIWFDRRRKMPASAAVTFYYFLHCLPLGSCLLPWTLRDSCALRLACCLPRTAHARRRDA